MAPRLIVALCMLLFILPLANCASCSRTESNVETRTTTLGQELEDLHNAKEKGIITEKEYEKKKKELMK